MDLCGHCNDTCEALLPAILPGDRLECEWMLVHRRDATLKSNPDVEIEVVEPNLAREDELSGLLKAGQTRVLPYV